MFVAAREQLRRSRHSRTFLVESGTGELWSELQTGGGNFHQINFKQLKEQTKLPVSATHTKSMNGSTVNSFSSKGYIWNDCDPYYDDDNDGAGKLGGPSAGFIILLTTYCFEFLVGDLFPLHLTVAQLMFFMAFPLFFINHWLWRSVNVLAVVTFLSSMVLIMKPLLLCLSCVEGYVAVVRPILYLRIKERGYRWPCLGVCWCIYIILAISSIVQRSILTLCLVFLPTFIIDTFCTLYVLRELKKTPPSSQVVRMEEREEGRAEEKEVGGSKPREKGKMNSMKKKAFVTFVIIQAVVSLNYLPLIITMTMEGRFSAVVMKCQYRTSGLAAAASCSYLQPLLYLHRLGRLPCSGNTR
ncbi:hypothetical protein KUCAC02_000234 [Chaenocephalus aceratus]|uniref:Uncharacterized protein n=1 Tax=Chaenocephalus aceratus TaxID=36190 RepID=A0ACB9W4Y7_CHAAC|nr:hypothetical protein KUCAC02_000234 [Chaenocephalus aceratus]